MKKNKNEASADGGKNKSGSKKAVLIIVNFVWMFAAYQVCIIGGDRVGTALPYKICTIVYGVALIALFAAYFFMNRGTSGKPTPKEELPRDWSPVKKQEFLDSEAAAFAKSKWLLCWIFPLLTVLLIDIVDLFVVEYLKQMFSSL